MVANDMITWFKNLFRKRKRKPMQEFSKWVVRMMINIIIFIVAFSVIIISAQTYILYQSVQNDSYSNVNVDLPALIEFAKDAALVLLGYICAAAFVNRKKVEVGFDPKYDDRFQPPDNDGGESEK